MIDPGYDSNGVRIRMDGQGDAWAQAQRTGAADCIVFEAAHRYPRSPMVGEVIGVADKKDTPSEAGLVDMGFKPVSGEQTDARNRQDGQPAEVTA